MTLTTLYQSGAITELQHRAVDAWLEDGRPLRRAAKKPRKARTEKPRDRDIMTASGIERYRRARKRLEAIGALDDLEKALAGIEADMRLALMGMDMLAVFYWGRAKDRDA